MRSWIGIGCVVTVFLLVLVAGLDPGAITDGLLNSYVFVPVFAALSLGLGVYYVKYFKAKPFMAEVGNFPRPAVHRSRAEKLRRDAERECAISTDQAKIFALVLAAPAAVRQRVVEDYEPNHRTLRQTVSVTSRIPPALLSTASDDEQIIYFPVLLAEKGELQDEFDVYTDGDVPAVVLAYREYLGFASAVLHGLLLAAYSLNVRDRLPEVARQAELHAIEDMMLRHTDKPAPLDYRGAQAVEKLDVKNEAVRDLAAKVVRKLTTHYAIVALVGGHHAGRFLVKYSRTLIPDAKLSESGTERRLTFGGWMRQMLGAKPVEIDVELDNASTCQSYHLRVAGPDGLYLASQETIAMGEIEERTAQDAPTPPHLRFRRRLGQAHAHFYARYFPEKIGGERPRVRFKYYETPPGSTFRAAVNALACFALVWLAGAMSMLSAGSTDPKSDLPAILLAFPAAAASWIGFEAPAGRLFEGTLSARFCLLATAILSIASSGLYIAHYIRGDKFSSTPLPYGLSFLWVSDLGWAILLLFALLNALYIGYRACFAGWCYAWLASRVDK